MAIKSNRLETAVAAGAVDAQILVGSDIEFLTNPSIVTFFIAQSATGLNVSIKADSNVLLPGAAPNVVAAAGRLIDPDDMVVNGVVLPAGTRLKIEADNPTGGILTLSTLVVVDEMVMG